MSKILIIEDEASIRRVLTKILSEENDTYQVEEAADGVEGLEKIKRKVYASFSCNQYKYFSKIHIIIQSYK